MWLQSQQTLRLKITFAIMAIGFTTLQLSACDDLLHNSPFCRARSLQQQCGYVNWRITLPDTAIVNILAHKSSSQSIIDLSPVIPRECTSLLKNNEQQTAVSIGNGRRNKACLVVGSSGNYRYTPCTKGKIVSHKSYLIQV